MWTKTADEILRTQSPVRELRSRDTSGELCREHPLSAAPSPGASENGANAAPLQVTTAPGNRGRLPRSDTSVAADRSPVGPTMTRSRPRRPLPELFDSPAQIGICGYRELPQQKLEDLGLAGLHPLFAKCIDQIGV